MITEVMITESSAQTAYAAKCPAGQAVEQFLTKLLNLVLFLPHSERVITVPGSNDTIDRADVTAIDITTIR